ncbi:MAG: aspartate aminotransferase family protein [Phycisphaerales bacterium]|nr:MAG: aspartate aminotransferase family protein [Phycisphaerales bacterium]
MNVISEQLVGKVRNSKLRTGMDYILKCHEMTKADIVRGHNCYLYDANNKRYVDFESGVWSTVLGHNHPRISRTIQEQIDRVMHLGYRYTNRTAEEAAAALLEAVGLEKGKCVFLSSGSEAVELAIQVAKLVTGKSHLLTLSESYMAAYGAAAKQGPDEWLQIDREACRTCSDKATCKDTCPKADGLPFEEIAAFVLEPASASGNVRLPPEKLVDLLASEVKQHQGLIVVDEVTTGLGRTGKWWGFEHYDLSPDVIAFGKGLGNGYPVSAVATKEEVADLLEARTFRYVQSHQNDPLGCAVAKEVISVIREEELIARSAALGESLYDRLDEIGKRHEFVREVRGRGLMVSLELAGAGDNPITSVVYDEMLERGYLIGHNPRSNVLRFLPPLTIEENEMANLAHNLYDILETLGRQ